MNLRTYIFLSVAVILLFSGGCQQNPTEPTATKVSSISGTVLDAGNNPLALARVVDIGTLAQVDTSKTDGSYILTLQLSNNYNTSLYAILSGYASDTPKVSLTPGDNLTGINIHLKIVDSSKIVGGNSGRPASIGLVSQSAKSILLKGGVNQSCTLIFLVVDSLNRPVTGTNKCKVKFTISVTNPSGETLKPDTAQTDPLTGQVSTTVFSGTKPNAILITAQVIDPTRKITATAGLTEGTGLPDGNHVSISATKFNIAGRVFDGLSTSIAMTVNDQFGNPVADGTPVSFVTNGGGITNDAFTTNGIATATLTSGGGNPPVGGLVTVTAEVKGDTSVRKADSSIVRTIQILFSGHTTVIRSSNTVNFEVPDGDMNYFDFTVSDDYGKPLVEGSTITVTVDAANDKIKSSLQLKGDQITMPDTKDTNQIHFRVWVIDKVKDSLSGVITFKIKISSPNGNYPVVDQDWFSGYDRGATSGIGFYGVPASVSLADSSSLKLYLAETQLPDTSKRITFIVRDGSGAPISVIRRALVTFSLLRAPNGTTISPNQDSTGQGGAVTVTITSGNVPGVAQVVAKTTDGSGNYFYAVSLPIEIAHGLPDSNQIFLSLEKNMFNSMGSQVGTLKINLADIYGNFPAPQYITFNTTGGVISPVSALSDANGNASTGLFGGKVPIDPVLGFGNVSTFIKVHGGGIITRKVPFVFSGAPIITPINVRTTDTLMIADGGYKDLTYSVADANRIPLAQGNTITVTVSGLAASGITLSNAVNTTIGTTDTNSTTYTVRISDATANGGISGNFDITISVTGPNGTATKIMKGILAAPLSGFSSSLTLLSASTTNLSVNGSGGTQTATLTYVVKDSLGNPVSLSRAATVVFSLSDTTGGARISPTSAVTNASGQVITVVTAGSVAKVVQVIAQVQGTIVYSIPTSLVISGGLPDANHLALVLSRKNYPGLVKSGSIGTVTIQAGDINGNPVADNTPLSFATTAGLIDPSALTVKGSATVNIYGGVGQPIPVDAVRGAGYGTITVSGIGVGGAKLSKSIPILFSGAPATLILDPTKVTGTVLNSAIPQNGSVTINFTIADANNRTLSSNNKITVVQSGDAAGELVLSGDNSLAFGDDTMLIIHQVTITDKGGSGGSFSLTWTCDGESGTLTKTITGVVVAPPPVVSGYASSIQLLSGSPSASTISVKGTGATETSTMSFVVKDSLGNPISINRQATVTFSIVGGPGGGEFLSPTSAITDAIGKVTTTVNAGTKAGVMQVVATTTLNSTSITSAPVPLTIASGLADSSHFTVWTDKPNWPGVVSQGVQIGTVSVQMGDKYGNPVQPNTALYFTATGGIITSSAFTDATGHASSIVYGGNPIPPFGIDTITVSTLGLRDTVRVTISKKVTVVYSGMPIVTLASTNLGTISVGSTLQVGYSVADANGNPLASSNTISVTIGGTAGSLAQLSGNTSFTTTDTTRYYQFAVTNNVPLGGTGGNFTVTMTVNGPNGTTTKLLTGTLASPSGTITAPTQIVLSALSNTIIAASGTGGNNTSNITFQALDAGGRAIGSVQSDTMFFTLSDTVGGAHLIPTWAMTDANGQASTKLYGGIKFGSPTITARMKAIVSQPVAVRISGPSWTNFNVTISANNLPGLSQIGTVVGRLNAQIGDTLGNPVLTGTIIKFTTSGGMIDASAATDISGSASVNISGGATPNEPSLGGIGWGYVTAQTQGNNGTILRRPIPFLFSGAPVITPLNLPASDTITVFDGGFVDVDYRIADINNNPLAAGNVVSVTVSGAAAAEIAVGNYFSFITNGTTNKNQTTFQVRISDKTPNAGTSGSFDVTITVAGPNGNAIKQFHGNLLAPGAIIPPSAEVKKAAQIAFINISASDIFVSGVGALENAVITYEVRDSLGEPVAATPKYGAAFSISFYPNVSVGGGTYPRVIPSADSTDTQGRLHASIVSGTQSGVIEIVAQILLPSGGIIASQPVKITVHAGFPDQHHFTLMPSRFVFPGWDYLLTPYPKFTVAVGDTFSNPVAKGTAVYFHSQAGVIETGFNDFNAYTDADGLATVGLLTVNPRPSVLPYYDPTVIAGRLGAAWVYAQTQSHNGTPIIDSVFVIWNLGPIIILGVPAGITMTNHSISPSVNMTVTDANGNPLCDGTTLSAQITLPAGVTGVTFDVTGSFSTTAPALLPVASYARFPGPGITDFTFAVTDNSIAATAGMTITVVLTINAPGLEKRIFSIPVTVK